MAGEGPSPAGLSRPIVDAPTFHVTWFPRIHTTPSIGMECTDVLRLSPICLMAWTMLPGVIASWVSPCHAEQELDGLAADPDFKPLVEAKMPAGFPGHTPVGTVEIKKYPAYRKAQTSGGDAFWKLFTHIKNNDIAMTAPVEMTFQSDGPPVGQEQAMAFLYSSVELGQAGTQGPVDVLDVPATTVVSIGVRGQRNEKVVARATERLRNWLTEHAAYRQSGPVRIMGYNSPFVPAEKQFFEVQIPLATTNDADPAAAQ